MMRIAFLVPAPFDLVTGGTEYDRRIVGAWRAAGHEVIVHELAGQHPLPDDAARQAARTVWSQLPDDGVVVIDNLGLASFSELADAFSTRHVIVLNHHPTGLETGLDPAAAVLLDEAERRLMGSATHVVTTSATTAATLSGMFAVAPERITIIEPGTAPAPRSVGSGTLATHILSIGSLIPRKGHDVLMRALARLTDLDWTLTIAGSARHDPATAERLRSMPHNLGIADRVRFLGEMTGAPLAELWRGADLFALATHYEGYGMVIAEALKRGLPVAVCNGGAAGALISADSGVVCPVGDVDQLSKALRRLIFDRALRSALADGAWAQGQMLADWPEQAARFAAVLADAMTGPKPG